VLHSTSLLNANAFSQRKTSFDFLHYVVLLVLFLVNWIFYAYAMEKLLNRIVH